jgi:hypothetical protein
MVYSPVHSNESAPSGVHIYGRSVHTSPEGETNNAVIINTKTSVERIAQKDHIAMQINLFVENGGHYYFGIRLVFLDINRYPNKCNICHLVVCSISTVNLRNL